MHTVNQMKTKFVKVFSPEQAEVLSEVINDAYNELVKTSDFNELKDIVKYLGSKMGELAEAQKRTENRVEELAEAQKQLAEAQKRTEKELRELVVEHKKTRRQLGGLTQDVGYGLEDKAMLFMADFVKKNYGINADRVERKNIVYPNGNHDELNIYVEGTKQGKKAFVIGECKSQPSKKDADKFHQMIERVQTVLVGEIFLFMVGYSFDPAVETYIREKYPKVSIFKSYDFEFNYKKVSVA
jgi:predicted nuclease with TOPRIM domain